MELKDVYKVETFRDEIDSLGDDFYIPLTIHSFKELSDEDFDFFEELFKEEVEEQ